MPELLVLTGVATARDVVLAPARQRPSLLAIDLRGLFAPHPAPEAADDGWWRCGSASARVVDGVLELSDDGTPRRLEGTDEATTSLDGWRALCVAAWEAADRGSPVEPAAVPHVRIG